MSFLPLKNDRCLGFFLSSGENECLIRVLGDGQLPTKVEVVNQKFMEVISGNRFVIPPSLEALCNEAGISGWRSIAFSHLKKDNPKMGIIFARVLCEKLTENHPVFFTPYDASSSDHCGWEVLEELSPSSTI